MSGGVDSSVAAALLKKQGYEVNGVFMRFWKKNSAESDAKKTAKLLQIPFEIINVRKKFKKEVIGYFLKEYSKGRTPNPCIFCNENIKFKILFKKMLELKADFVATGHYARVMEYEKKGIKQKSKIRKTHQKLISTKNYQLFEAKDKNKDQSYFLYRLKQKPLAKIIFPLGNYKKDQIKKMAKQLNLPSWNKKESQDICFLAESSLKEFLKNNLKMKKGNIVDQDEKIRGKHSGLALFTIGQRKNINLGGNGPYFVIKKDYKKNELIVSNRANEPALFSKEIILKKVNWIVKKPKLPMRILVRTRYRNLLVYATIKKIQVIADKTRVNRYKYAVKFEKPQKALTPGQSAVFYNENGDIKGGGIIERVNKLKVCKVKSL